MADLLDRCDLVVGVDTGLLHMAGALDVPWVGLFGPTNPEVTGPYDRSNGIALVASFVKAPTCGDCWKHFKYEDDTCRALNYGSCMDYLEEEEVLQACFQLLARGRARLDPRPYDYPVPSPVDALVAGWTGTTVGV